MNAAARRAASLAARRVAAPRFLATDAAAVVHPPTQAVRVTAVPGDSTHTAKWLSAPQRSPQEWIAAAPPLEVATSNVARCYGGTHPSLGHPVEYIKLDDTSAEFPATCKYCGLRYFQGHGHHH